MFQLLSHFCTWNLRWSAFLLGHSICAARHIIVSFWTSDPFLCLHFLSLSGKQFVVFTREMYLKSCKPYYKSNPFPLRFHVELTHPLAAPIMDWPINGCTKAILSGYIILNWVWPATILFLRDIADISELYGAVRKIAWRTRSLTTVMNDL